MNQTGSSDFRTTAHDLLLVVVIFFLIFAGAALLGHGAGQDTTIRGIAEVVSGMSVLSATLLGYLWWRVTSDPRIGWVVAGLVPVTSLLLTRIGADLGLLGSGRGPTSWGLLVAAITMTAAAGFACAAVRSPIPGLPGPFTLGLGVSVLAASAQWAQPHVAVDGTVPITILAAILIAAHAVLAIAVLRNRAVPRGAAWPLAAALALIPLAYLASPSMLGWGLIDLVVDFVLAGAALLWATSALALVTSEMDGRAQRAADLEEALSDVESAHRGAREQMHEVKSTIAGLTNASELIVTGGLDQASREHLQDSMHGELARLGRLCERQTPQPSAVDLDRTLDRVIELHRVRGHAVEWEPTGERVLASPDTVAETVNILLDNAVEHSGSTRSRVSVSRPEDASGMVQISVTDSGAGVPADLRQQIFEWGARGPDSHGQGIGLHLAHRLIAEQGGSLTLGGTPDNGASFTIRLPAARRSRE